MGDASGDRGVPDKSLVAYSREVCVTVVQIKLVLNVLCTFRAISNGNIKVAVEIKIAPGMAFGRCVDRCRKSRLAKAKISIAIVQVQLIAIAATDVGDKQVGVPIVVRVSYRYPVGQGLRLGSGTALLLGEFKVALVEVQEVSLFRRRTRGCIDEIANIQIRVAIAVEIREYTAAAIATGLAGHCVRHAFE